MTNQRFHDILLEMFAMNPTSEQSELFHALETFMRQRSGKELFVLKGYAGTGKTSVMAAFVKALYQVNVRTKLIAPTGRAAKVFCGKAGTEALTIHKQIYRRKSKVDISSPLSLQPNLNKYTVFIVDEASMIGDYTMQSDGNVSARNLLEDLFEYVYSGEGCRLILMGDNGQLPPVGSNDSPALSEAYLEHHYPELSITSFTLNTVLRQAEDSGILHNATLLRNAGRFGYPTFVLDGFQDIVRIQGAELQESLESSLAQLGTEESIVITRSNKWANKYNQQIRGRILWYEEALCQGDTLMVVRNNYFWKSEDSNVGFIANGEMMTVQRILKYESFYGFEFARVLVSFIDDDGLEDLEVIIHLESLTSEEASMPRERMKELFFEVEKDYAHIREKKKRYAAILGDPFFNALQVKYAYAVTCHKSQGGQWQHVYIDQGYVTEAMMGEDYYRWLYTALTRSSKKVFLINFKDDYFT